MNLVRGEKMGRTSEMRMVKLMGRMSEMTMVMTVDMKRDEMTGPEMRMK